MQTQDRHDAVHIAPPHPALRTRSLGCEEQEAEGVIMQAQAELQAKQNRSKAKIKMGMPPPLKSAP
jgi:hypothetical protein